MKVCLDIEADGLEATKIHVVVCRNIDTNEVHTFKDSASFRSFVSGVDLFIGHNIIGYDWYWLAKIWGITLDATKIRDTLILSQLFHQGIEGGHSLEAWGERLGTPKLGTNITDFSTLTAELMERCISDTSVNAKLYSFLSKKLDRPEFKEAIDVEHRMAFICLGMHLDGFAYNKQDADTLYLELSKRQAYLDGQISEAFKPKARLIREVKPRRTKFGTLNKQDFRWYGGDDLSSFGGGPFSLFEYVPFDPNSIKQTIERLEEAGWKPIDKTKTGKGWKLNETNLATLPETAPKEASYLVERLLVASRVRTLETWASAYKAGRIHGRFHTVGTWTHRMRHTNPNMGNIAAHKTIKYRGESLKKQAIDLGAKMRSLWIASPGTYLVGTDAVGIQLRVFAHYINDRNFTESLIGDEEQKKREGKDAHSLNAKILGCSRDTAKTFIYAFLLGAGDAKIGEILGLPLDGAKRAKAQFIAAYPGLAALRANIIPRDAKRGYFQGFDGRLIVCDSEHHMLAGYLQAGEALIMKHANILWRKQLHEAGIHFRQVNFVHDEWQTEVRGDRTLAERVGSIQAAAIASIGERFKLHCPMAGSYSVGKNWLETH